MTESSLSSREFQKNAVGWNKMVDSGKEKLKRNQFINKKKKEFQEKMKMPPFLRNIDKMCGDYFHLYSLTTPVQGLHNRRGSHGGHDTVHPKT